VGEWQRTQTCDELRSLLIAAGMQQAVLPTIAEDDWIPGVSKPSQIADPTHPCRAAKSRLHSHFFTAAGDFGSRDANGNQVDDGTYRIVDGSTFAIGGADHSVTFRYRLTGQDTISFEPVIPKCRPTCFEAIWSVTVAYAGHTWHRVH
jgi:hypothetical protein